MTADVSKYYRRVARSFIFLGAGILVTGFLTSALRAESKLARAFAFGSRSLTCPTFNDPSVDYTMVLQTVDGEAAADELQYDSARGWGYVVTGSETGGVRSRFGPMDSSLNFRSNFSIGCSEQLYDPFIGGKDFSNMCNDANPCSDLCEAFPATELDCLGEIIFRVDVCNATYRFVGAFGDAEFPHAHNILIEDGETGNMVQLVRNFDQSQFAIGEADFPPSPTPGGVRGDGVYAQVGFDGKIPPPGDGVAPDPIFLPMDENGDALPLGTPPDSPALEVTSGFIRVHQAQGLSNPGPGGPGGGNDPNGGDMVILELWTTVVIDGCDSGVGILLDDGCVEDSIAECAASARNHGQFVRCVAHVTNDLKRAGIITGREQGAIVSCAAQANIPAAGEGGGGGLVSPLFLRGDCDGDGSLNLSDAVCALHWLFEGGGKPGCITALNTNGDEAVNIADPVSVLSFLFAGGPAPVAPFPDCGAADDEQLGCETPPRNCVQ